MAEPVTRAQVAALLAVCQDHALGQPPGALLRAAVVGQRLAEAAGASPALRADAWWTSTLRFLGCTGHAYDMAVVFGDEIEMRAKAARSDASNPFELLRVMVSFAGRDQHGAARLRSVLAILAGGKREAERNFRTACEVADVFAKRFGAGENVLSALGASFERWNGRGLPDGVKGTAIPWPMRVAQLSQEFEILARIEGVERARGIVGARRAKAYDPVLTDLVVEQGTSWWHDVEAADPWDAALAAAPACPPRPRREARGPAGPGRLR